MRSTLAVAAFVGISICSVGFGQRIGDNWTTTRGDETPNLSYSAATTTTSGRIIAVGANGALMYSDDGGTDWKFGQIKIGGLPVFGGFNTIFQVPGGSLIAVMARLEESSEGYFDYYVRTYFLTSSDDGDSWSMEPFPLSHATYELTGRAFPGVHIAGLSMSPGGELMAYGTTTGTNHPGAIYWNIGGAIFRRAGATWTQAHFGYGPVGKLTRAGGRSVAVAHNAVLDSADGSAWSGYVMSNAQVDLDGSAMDPKTKSRLRVIDIEYLDGNYIAQGGTFVPFDETELIDSNIFDEIFLLGSPTPFSGARNWNAYTQPNYYGPFTKSGDYILAASPGGVYRASSASGGFALATSDVRAWASSIALSGSTSVAVQSSETVWKSSNNGAAWTKVWNKEVGPVLRLLGFFGGALYAVNGSNGDLWLSRDNGQSWQRGPASYKGTPLTMVEGAEGRVISPAPGGFIQYSDDGGATWTKQPVPGSGVSPTYIARTSTGRLILPGQGNILTNKGELFVSDDNGATWTSKAAPHRYQDAVRGIVTAKSGRIILATTNGSLAEPTVHYSDDEGETWDSSDALQSLEGLSVYSNDSSETFLQIKKVRVSDSGRIVILGDDEIVTSDDEGETWRVRVNLNLPPITPNPHYTLRDVQQAGERWFAVGTWQYPYPDDRNQHFLLISDDDGSTWAERPFKTNENTTWLNDLAVGADGRLIIAGGNSAIFVSDPPAPPPPGPQPVRIRESTTGTVLVERPPLDGAVEARYALISQSAVAGEDFVAAGGFLNWGAGDVSDKPISIETIDNAAVDGERELALRVVFETAEGLLGEIENPVVIEDDDSAAGAGLVIDGASAIYTTEDGGAHELRFALQKKPTADVTITISGLDATEGALSATQFTFTPANWNQWQTLIVTGLDDSFPDGDAAYELKLDASSTDAQYAALPTLKLPVVNVGDEPYQVGGELLDSSDLAAYAGHPVALARDGTLSFRVPDSLSGIGIGSEISEDLRTWTPGPAPVAGASDGGFTTYTIQLPEADPAVFARVTFSLE